MYLLYYVDRWTKGRLTTAWLIKASVLVYCVCVAERERKTESAQWLRHQRSTSSSGDVQLDKTPGQASPKVTFFCVEPSTSGKKPPHDTGLIIFPAGLVFPRIPEVTDNPQPIIKLINYRDLNVSLQRRLRRLQKKSVMILHLIIDYMKVGNEPSWIFNGALIYKQGCNNRISLKVQKILY